MKTIRLTVPGITAAILLGSAVVQAGDTDTTVDQRNRVWSMQGVQDGSYSGMPVQAREQKRIREQQRLRQREHAYPGGGQGSRYGQGYESRAGNGGFGSGAGTPGRSGGQGGGRR